MPDQPGTALATTGLDNILTSLTERERGLTVTDQQSYTAAANFILEANSYVKDVGAKLDPGINSAKTHLDFLKNQKAGYVEPVKRLAQLVKERCETFRANEKARAEAEQRRLQEAEDRKRQTKSEEDRRAAEAEAATKRAEAVKQINADLKAGIIGKREAAKRLKEAGAEAEAAKATAAAVAEEQAQASPPVVRVAPSIPVVAGVKNQTYYGADLTDGQAIIRAYETAKDPIRIAFLRRFIQVNEQEIGKFARETKDPEKVMELLPGVRAWSKG
jgi:DNA repair exonuclease SbcCD ATPase subunit